jgi:hypothetical protein
VFCFNWHLSSKVLPSVLPSRSVREWCLLREVWLRQAGLQVSALKSAEARKFLLMGGGLREEERQSPEITFPSLFAPSMCL